MADWKLTVRDGSDVSRLKYGDLEAALEAALEQIEKILDRPPLKEVKAIRDYAPEKLVKARIEISGKGLFSPPTAGVDIRGDNSLLGFAGGVTREPLQGETARQVVEAMRQTLTR